MTLAGRGQGNVGSAPVASVTLPGAWTEASSTLVVAWASRALCGGPPVAAAVLVAGAAKGAAGATAAGCGADATGAVFAPRPGGLAPRLGLAYRLGLLAFTNSPT